MKVKIWMRVLSFSILEILHFPTKPTSRDGWYARAPQVMATTVAWDVLKLEGISET